MHWTEALGRPMPKKFGGHPALELCNTRAGWGQAMQPEFEWIPSYDRLAIWAWYQGLISEHQRKDLREYAGNHPAQAGTVLTQFRDLRTALYSVLTNADNRNEFDTVAELAQKASQQMRLIRLDDGTAQWRLPRTVTTDLPVLAAAAAAAEILCSALRSKVSSCPGSDCGWLFINARGRRRWCSMASCGNRSKARAYAKRQS